MNAMIDNDCAKAQATEFLQHLRQQGVDEPVPSLGAGGEVFLDWASDQSMVSIGFFGNQTYLYTSPGNSEDWMLETLPSRPHLQSERVASLIAHLNEQFPTTLSHCFP